MTGSARRGFATALVAALLLASGLVPSLQADASSRARDDSACGAPSRAVERPDHDGPYVNGTVTEHFRGSTKLYSIDLKIYYPAVSAGTDTPADTSGAPYPTILMMPYAGSDENAYDYIAPRLVSWGFVIVTVGQNQADQNSGNSTDLNDILDQLVRDNATASHRLLGMVNAGAFGISGHSRGGAYSVIDGWSVPRLRAVQAMAPALAQSDVDAMAGTFAKSFQVQVGRLDTSFWSVSLYSYKAFKPPKSSLDLANTGHGGPFYWDLAISFFFRYLLGLTAYETFLYGDSAMNDAADTKYFLNFTLPDGSFFPPNLTVAADKLSPEEDSPVRFALSWDGALPLGHPRSNFTWDFTSDGHVERSGPYESAANASFTRAGTTTVTARFELGGLLLGTNNTLRLDVRDPPPDVTVGADLSAAEDEAVTLSASAGDTPSDLGSLSFSWDFGDGTVAVSANASHAWKQAGNYTARVSVTDDEGASVSGNLTVSVRNLPPTAAAGPDVETAMDGEVALEGSGDDTPSDRAGLRYRWDFGDGLSGEWSIEPNTTHVYTGAGRFLASLWVQDGDGATARSTVNVTVRNLPPSCAVSSPRPGAALQKDEPAELDGGGTDTASDRPSLQYSWDMGDGNSTDWASSARAFHTYTHGGKYTAVLNVRDRAGAVARSSVNFSVVNQPPTVRIAAPSGGDLEEDSAVGFRAEGQDTASDADFLRYSWLIDGRTLAGRSVAAAFTTEGAHDFCVTVTDPEGAAATAAGTVFIGNPAPLLTASLEPDSLLLYDSIRFSASAEDTASDLGALTFTWDFGDGSSSSGPSGTHVYKQAGTFSVKATVRDDEGARDVRTFTVRVNEPPTPQPNPGTVGRSGSGMPAGTSIAALAVAVVLAMAVVALVLLRRRRA
jgi:PKD repeat protein